MIEARIEKAKGEYMLCARGHANYAPYGKDLICAAVSALLHGMGEYVEKAEREGSTGGSRIRLERGDALIITRPLPGKEGETAGAFGLAGQVLAMLSLHYPENISFSVIEKEEEQ